MDAKKPAAVSDPPRSEKESRARPDSTNDVKANKKIKKAPRAEEITYPVKPNTIHVVRGKKSVVNHTYRDFSNVPPAVPYTMPKAVEDRSFPENLYCLLSEKKQYSSQAIEWCSHGRAFRILNRDFLEKYGLLKLYFGFNSFKKFVKRLNDNDFRKLTTGPDKECFYSEVRSFVCFFLRDTSLLFLFSLTFQWCLFSSYFLVCPTYLRTRRFRPRDAPSSPTPTTSQTCPR